MKRSIFLSLAFLLILTQLALAQIPQTLSYQGLLTDAAGEVVADDNYNLRFTIYDAAEVGASLWSENTTLTVSSGVFNAVLGSKKSLNLEFDKPYWLGISVNGGDELSPRVQLTSAAYSLNSKSVRGGTNVFPSDGNVGIGTMSPKELLDVNGDAHVRGKLTSGDANLSLPIAYAHIDDGASILSGTNNISCQWNDTDKKYEITISDVSYSQNDFITIVTTTGSHPTFATSAGSGGKLLISIHNLSGERIQDEFQFVTYQP